MAKEYSYYPDVRDGLNSAQRKVLLSMNRHHEDYERTACIIYGNEPENGWIDSTEPDIYYQWILDNGRKWRNILPLIDIKGNAGDIALGAAANARFTGCRLTEFAGDVLLSKDMLDPALYSKEEWGKYPLPAEVPIALVVGGNGILRSLSRIRDNERKIRRCQTNKCRPQVTGVYSPTHASCQGGGP